MRLRAAVFALSALLATGAAARPQAGGVAWNAAQIDALQAELDAALASQPALRGAQVGLIAVDTVRGTPLYQRNATTAFVPASNFKLLVGSAAMTLLGPRFAFTTQISADVPPEDGTIHGNLYLQGGADAELSAADLRDAAQALARGGVRRIDGELIADASHDDDARLGPGWSWDDLPYAYAAPVSALELELGMVHVFVTPGMHAGDPVRLRVEPASGAFQIENRATTGAPGSQDTTDLVRPANAPAAIAVVGSYPVGSPESDDLQPSVPDPPAYAASVLTRSLAAVGIAVTGGTRAGVTPLKRVVLWSHRSVAMPELLAHFWQPSNNLMAELLLKELGTGSGARPGTYAGGAAAEDAYLETIGVDPASVSIADGSGLSPYDRITPADLLAILQSDWNGAQRDAILDALPQAGVRGTLQYAFASTPLAGKLFAKTGSERHVRALSGFLQTDAHGPVTFSLLINGWLGDDRAGGAADLAHAEDALLEAFEAN